jgi:two-component system nitrate/nitrite response regulator NarL
MLVDSSTLFRQGLKHLLPSDDFKVVAEASEWEEAVGKIEPGTLGLILLDAPDTASLRAGIKALREASPGTRVVHLANVTDATRVLAALESGADGCLSKDRSPEALVQSLRLVMLGEKVMPPEVAAFILRRPETPPSNGRAPRGLSAREMQILQGLLRGHSNKMIAIELDITEATVKVHLKSLLRKVGCSNRTQAAIWALNNGIAAVARPAELAA